MTVTTFRWIDWLKGTDTMEMKAERRYHVALELTESEAHCLEWALRVAYRRRDEVSPEGRAVIYELANQLDVAFDLGYGDLPVEG